MMQAATIGGSETDRLSAVIAGRGNDPHRRETPPRVLIFFDTRHQDGVVGTLTQILENGTGAIVMPAGPGAGLGTFQANVTDVDTTTCGRWRLALPDQALHKLKKARRLLRRTRSRILRHRWVRSLSLLLPYRKIKRARILFLRELGGRAPQSDSKAHFYRALRNVKLKLGVPGVIYVICGLVVSMPVLLFNLDVLVAYRHQRRWTKNCSSMINDARPDLVILLEDNVEGLTGFVSHTAYARRIPVLIVPYYIPNPLEPARFYAGSPDHGIIGWRDRLIVRWMPAWQYDLDGVQMIRLPAPVIIAQRLLGRRSPRPWILNSGYAQRIALDCERLHRHYLDLGFEPSRLEVIGSPQDDALHRLATQVTAVRDVRLSALGLDPSKLLVVCGFPPDQYSSPDISRFEFSRFDDLTAAWFTAFEELRDVANIIVRPHPRLDATRLRQWESDTVKIEADMATDEVLPMGDLYVASISTTLRWALALAIPVVNYDTYRYDYGDFRNAKGAIDVDNLAAFRSVLSSILRGSKEYAALRAAAFADRRSWGIADGLFAERFVRLSREVIREGVPMRSTHPAPVRRYPSRAVAKTEPEGERGASCMS